MAVKKDGHGAGQSDGAASANARNARTGRFVSSSTSSREPSSSVHAASGQFVVSQTSKRVIRSVSAAHKDALKRLVDR